MSKLNETISKLEAWIDDPNAMNTEIDACLVADALELLKEQNRSKHGHWVVLENCSNAGVYCSECHTKMFDRYPMKKKFSQYCGHCGAHNDLQVEVR